MIVRPGIKVTRPRGASPIYWHPSGATVVLHRWLCAISDACSFVDRNREYSFSTSLMRAGHT